MWPFQICGRAEEKKFHAEQIQGSSEGMSLSISTMLQMIKGEYILSMASAKYAFMHKHMLFNSIRIFLKCSLCHLWIEFSKWTRANINSKCRSSGIPHAHKSFNDFHAFYAVHAWELYGLFVSLRLFFYECPYKYGPYNHMRAAYFFLFLLSAFTIIICIENRIYSFVQLL